MGLFTFWTYDFIDNETWYNDLLAEDTKAIAHLAVTAKPKIQRLCKSYGIAKEVSEDMVIDCICILIKHIRSGNYKYQGYSPVTYLMRIAHFSIMNVIRRPGTKNEIHLDPDVEFSDKDLASFYETKEKTERLRHIITTRLGEPCRQLIWLKYIDGWKDKEIIEKNLTQYRTVQALINARSNCLINLRRLLAELNITLIKL